MEKTELLFLVLAGIVHDVGKFAQRAGAPSSKDMEDTYCPQSAHGGTHRHVIYMDYFVEHELSLPRELEGKRSLLARIASAHHKPDEASRMEKCLQQGNWLASGHDRIPGDSEGGYKTARIESIFGRVCLRDKSASQKHGKLLLYSLNLISIY